MRHGEAMAPRRCRYSMAPDAKDRSKERSEVFQDRINLDRPLGCLRAAYQGRAAQHGRTWAGLVVMQDR